MSTISEDQGDAPGTDPTSTPYTITVNDIFDGLLTMRQEAPTEEDYVRLAMTPGYGYYLTLELPDPEYDHVTMELHDAAGEQIINWAGPWLGKRPSPPIWSFPCSIRERRPHWATPMPRPRKKASRVFSRTNQWTDPGCVEINLHDSGDSSSTSQRVVPA